MSTVAQENNTKHECLVIAILTFGGKTGSNGTVLFDAKGEIFDLERVGATVENGKVPGWHQEKEINLSQ